MKYDCSKTLDYKHELIRMCRSDVGCEDCALAHMGCNASRNITQEHIDEVQKWSDEHPEITRKDNFFELLKNTEFEEIFSSFDDKVYMDFHGVALHKSLEDWWNEVVE